MKAWVLPSFGSIDRLRLEDVPPPRPGPGEALVEVLYAALNPADRFLAEGMYPAHPPLPHILGRDAVGRIAAGGNSATPDGSLCMILRGEVGVERAGTFAREVAVPLELLTPLPAGFTEEEAACGTLVYLTAWQALTQFGPLAQAVVLVSGASGGVGVAVLQLAKSLGHTVIGLSRSGEKAQRLLKMGAAFVANPQEDGWDRQVRRFLGERRVDLFIDNVAGAGFQPALDLLGPHGKVSVVGRSGGAVPEFNTAKLFFRRIRIGGVAVGTYTPGEARGAWVEVVRHLQQAGEKPLVDAIFPFEQLPQAFARLHAGPMGKVVLAVGKAAPATAQRV